MQPDDAGWAVPEHRVEAFAPRSTRYAVAIPVIDEGERIIRQLEAMRRPPEVPDVIICDGGSRDGSTEPRRLAALGVRALLTKTGPGRLAAQERMGFAFALREGYGGVIRMDGNAKDDPAGIAALVAALDDGCDFVQGSRFVPGGVAERTPSLRLLAIRAIHAPVISLLAGERFTDTTNAFRGHSRRYLTHPEVQPFRDVFQGYELLAYLSVRASQLGLRTCEVPVARRYPPGRTPTKIRGLRGSLELLDVLRRLARREFHPSTAYFG
ncbi:MAG: glycosyltransferase family 2 protein [Actinobacteria bacterium]|nr:glycosyltransferase family 2 protein [Actinomycetota bacterium]